jgi:integrase
MGDDGTVTLATYLERWLERRRAHLRPSTHSGYGQIARRYLAPTLGDQMLAELDRRAIEEAYAYLLREGGAGGRPLAPRTVRYAHAVLHRALKDAVIDELIDDNPASHAQPPKLDPFGVTLDEEFQVWNAEQAARFLDFVDGHEWRALWHLAVGTGARRGELLGLRWKDVDLDASQVRVRRALSVVDGVVRLLGTKTSQARTLSIGASVVCALQRRRCEQADHRATAGEWHDRWGLVFTDADGRHLHPMDVTMEFRRVVRSAPVPVIRMHDVRHTHASLLLQQGTALTVVSERLGHTHKSTTLNIYAHVVPAADGDAAARFERELHGEAPEPDDDPPDD